MTPAPSPASRPSERRAHLGLGLAAFAGVVLAVGVVCWFGLGQVLAALERLGWGGFALFVLYSLAGFPVTGGAWWVLAPKVGLRRLPAFVFGRLLREGASDILPLSSLGGVLIGARGVLLQGVNAATTYGSLALDLITEIIAQIGFLALGLALLSAHLAGGGEAASFRLCFFAAIALALGLILMLVVAERRGFGFLGRIAARFAPTAGAKVQGVREVMTALYRDPLRLLASVALHLAGWIASALGSWVVLHLMGVGISVPAVLAIESLLSAVKSAAFIVPNAIGVQEAAYAMLAQVFGLSGELGVALSLLKRAKDLVIGAPTLLVWQAMEGGRLISRRRAGSGGVRPRSSLPAVEPLGKARAAR